MKPGLFFYFSFLLLHHAAFSQVDTDKRLKGLDTIVNQVMKDWRVAGCAIAVVEKNKVIYARGFGYRDFDKKLPVTPNTVFSIASCTKAFTAALMGCLANDGKIDINQPIHQYYPEMVFYNDLLTNHVTVRDMLAHRTGMPRHDWLTHSKIPLPIDSIVHRIRYLEPSAPFRDRMQYCNLMYTALGGLVKKLTGRTWEDYMNEKILLPLEMDNTSCLISDLTRSREYSLGYTVRNDSIVRGNLGTDGANPAGSINASVNDMANWLIALVNDGQYKGKQILPSRFLREATSSQMSTPSRPRPGLPAYPDIYFGDYGYGWNIASYRGHYFVTHSGDLPLFSSTTSLLPTDSIGIVVLVNKFNASIPEIITNHIADKLLSLPYKDWNRSIYALQNRNSRPRTGVMEPEINVTGPSHPLQDYSGKFMHPAYGSIEVIHRNDTLYATHNELPVFFRHFNYDIFRAGVPGGKLQFHMDKEGRIVSVSAALEPAVSDIVFRKL